MADRNQKNGGCLHHVIEGPASKQRVKTKIMNCHSGTKAGLLGGIAFENAGVVLEPATHAIPSGGPSSAAETQEPKASSNAQASSIR